MIRRPLAVLLLLGATLASAASAQDGNPIIVLINPNSNETATQSMADLARGEIGDAATIEGLSNASAPPLLTTPEDMANAIPGVVAAGVEAAEDPRVARDHRRRLQRSRASPSCAPACRCRSSASARRSSAKRRAMDGSSASSRSRQTRN